MGRDCWPGPAAERFVVEIKTTASLSHPRILPLFDSGTADGFLYYVMPFIAGEPPRRTVLVERAIFPRDASSGHLPFVCDGTIFAAPFDAKSLRVLGPEVPMIQDMAWAPTDGAAGYDVTPDGAQFLMVIENQRNEALPTVVIVNWHEELKRRVPR